jgi:ABC-type polysaccharide/polyol phosphate export permease
MFLTPIFYLESAVPAKFQTLLSVNPLNHLMSGYRAVLLEGRMPDIYTIFLFGVIAFGIFIVGYWIFEKEQPNFVDYV